MAVVQISDGVRDRRWHFSVASAPEVQHQAGPMGHVSLLRWNWLLALSATAKDDGNGEVHA